MKTISEEYRQELANQHKAKDGWGSTGAKYAGGEVLTQLFTNRQATEVLDYGAGKQSLKPFLNHFFPNIQYVPYDPGIPGIDQKPQGRYSIVTCIDVLEHIEKEHAANALAEMAALTKYSLILDIACYPTNKLFESGPYKGQDLHINICPPDVWHNFVLEILEEEFVIQKYAPSYMFPLGGQARPRALIVLDRKY